MVTKKEFEKYCKDHSFRYNFDKNYGHELGFSIEENLEVNFNKWIFIVVSCYGYIETAEWLSTLKEIDIRAEHDIAFKLCCEYNHKDVAELIYSFMIKKGKPENFYSSIVNIFFNSCLNGCKDIVEFTYDVSIKEGKPFNIKKNEHLFIGCCQKGFLDIAVWLYNLSIEQNDIVDIHSNYDGAFILSCSGNHKNVAEWLCSLCDDYYIVIKDNEIFNFGIKNVYDKIINEQINMQRT
jgi:hypothetical protein